MKYSIITIVLSLIISTSCHTQQLMKTLTVTDAKKLKTNEQIFINKPLKTLLKEIKPQIKMVTASPTWAESAGRFTFKFVDYKQDQKIVGKRKAALRITVYVKEKFVWDDKKRFDEKKLSWSKEDEEKYGNLTIIRIDVSGEETNE